MKNNSLWLLPIMTLGAGCGTDTATVGRHADEQREFRNAPSQVTSRDAAPPLAAAIADASVRNEAAGGAPATLD